MHLQNSDDQALEAQTNTLTWQAWQTFWASHLGKEVLRVEAELLAPIMESLCGYHVLSVGSCPSKPLLASCTIKHQIEWRPNFELDRKSTRLNSSHVRISYAVFCLKKK